MRILKLANPMMSGDDVRQVQNIVGATVDGIFGPETRSKVIDFQAKMNLVQDGIVGENTWKAIEEFSGEKPKPARPRMPVPASAGGLNNTLLTAGGIMLLAGIGIAIWKNRG